MDKRGHFIVLEGPDCSGTSRQSEFLAERLKREGHDVLLTAEPTHGSIGLQIRSILHAETLPPPDAIQLLFCTDRAEHLSSEILPALEEGKTVICDRYITSTLAYGEATGVDIAWLKDLNKNFIQPDILIFTLPPFEICQERMGKREKKDAFEERGLQERVHKIYVRMAEEDPSIINADTSGKKEETAGKIFSQVMERLVQ